MLSFSSRVGKRCTKCFSVDDDDGDEFADLFTNPKCQECVSVRCGTNRPVYQSTVGPTSHVSRETFPFLQFRTQIKSGDNTILNVKQND
jgi:hypothetical protein